MQQGHDGFRVSMHDKNYENIKQEQMSWLKTLEGLRQENVFLKNRLAEIIKDNVSTEILEKAEQYLAIFIDKDTVISLLRRDIAKLSAATTANLINGEINKTLLEQAKLKYDVERMSKEFTTVKTNFNAFLAESAKR